MRFCYPRAGGAHLVQVFRDGQRGLHVGSFPWIALSVRVGADTQAFARGDGRGRLRFDRPGDHVVDRGQKRRVAREVLLRRRDRPLAPRPERQPADGRHERRASPDPRQGTNVHPAFVVVPRVVRPRRGIVDGVGFAFSRRARLADHARRRAARPRGIARPSARLRETKRDASEAPTARDSSRTWRGGVCVARNNGEDVTLSSARGIELISLAWQTR